MQQIVNIPKMKLLLKGHHLKNIFKENGGQRSWEEECKSVGSEKKQRHLQFWPLMKRPASIFQEWTHVITHSPPGLIKGAEVFWGDGWNLVKTLQNTGILS